MIGAREQSAIRDLAVWYIQQTDSQESLRSLADEIAYLKTAVPLRKSDIDTLTQHYRKQQQVLKSSVK
jgi:hypothetical protein